MICEYKHGKYTVKVYEGDYDYYAILSATDRDVFKISKGKTTYPKEHHAWRLIREICSHVNDVHIVKDNIKWNR